MNNPNFLLPDFQQAIREKTISRVWLEHEDQPVSINPQELFHDPVYDFTIQEEADAEGNVWVSNMFVPQGLKTPKWLIKPAAGEGNYVEQHVVIAGKGVLRKFRADGSVISEVRLDATDAPLEQVPAVIAPGDIFQVEADTEQGSRLEQIGLVAGVMICAVMRRVPFDIGFEERLNDDWPTHVS